MSDNNFNTAHLMLAFLGGAAAGAVAGILLAPKSGKETREMLAGYVKEGRERLAHMPAALKEASSAAKHKFNQTMAEDEQH